MAWAGFPGRGRETRASRTALLWLLPRLDVACGPALRRRPNDNDNDNDKAGCSGGADHRGTEAHSGRRGLHVVGVRHSGNDRVANMAAPGGDCPTLLLAAGSSRQPIHVPAAGRSKLAPGLARVDRRVKVWVELRDHPTPPSGEAM